MVEIGGLQELTIVAWSVESIFGGRIVFAIPVVCFHFVCAFCCFATATMLFPRCLFLLEV